MKMAELLPLELYPFTLKSTSSNDCFARHAYSNQTACVQAGLRVQNMNMPYKDKIQATTLLGSSCSIKNL